MQGEGAPSYRPRPGEPTSDVPSDSDLSTAQSFIAEYISTAEQLDVLLLLHSERARDFTAAEASQRIYTVPSAATLRMEELIALGLANSDGAANPRYRYSPASHTRWAKESMRSRGHIAPTGPE